MAAKIRNKVRQFLYRPINKRTKLDFAVKRLTEAEKALDATVGGMLKRKKRRRARSNDDEED